MLQLLWVMAQSVTLTLGVALGPLLPQSPIQVLVLVLVGAAVLALLAPWILISLLRRLSLRPQCPPPRSSRADSLGHRVPGAPGTPGCAFARAPSVAALAIA
ncbi:hypothetical protein [Solicola gregarius]|uniref:Uncharacterized protein n=1 Tax=Solicola gregarius TaxID=2908642 RepID=A0AA46TEF8_9ACTN|nr:hypothetical protein [Solicola gregarius]UYM03847.1 hypothetical protein L0C25_15005 [Solicola gregarius]